MQPIFLTKTQIGNLLATTPEIARRELEKRGCAPVDYGPGRSRGLRWLRAEVERIAREMHDDAQPPQPHPKKPLFPRGPRPIQGRSMAELYAELTSGDPMQ